MGYQEYMYGGRVNTETGAQVAMPARLAEVIGGTHFLVSGMTTTAAATATVNIVRCGGSPPVMQFNYECDQSGRLEIWEAATTTAITTTASAVTAYNTNRNNGTGAVTDFYPGATATVATASCNMLYAQAFAAPMTAGITIEDKALYLRPNRDYLFVFWSNDASNTATWQHYFFE